MRKDRVKTTAVLAWVACSSLIGGVSGCSSSDSGTDAQARVEQHVVAQERQMFTRTGRMGRQDIRYGEHRTQIIAEQDIEPQAQVTQARMR